MSSSISSSISSSMSSSMSSSQPSSKHNVALFAFAFIGLIWGSNFIFMKLAAAHISPMQIVFVRVFFGFVPVAIVALVTKSLSLAHLKHWPHFFAMGLLATVIYYFGFAKGTSLLNSGIAGAISGAIPLFSLVAALLFLKEERVTKWKLIGTGLGFIGVFMLARPFDNQVDARTLSGVTYMMLGSFSVGVSFVYAKRFISPLKLSPLALTTYQLGAGLVVLACVTDFTGISHLANDTTALVSSIFGLGLLGTGVAYLCYYYIIEHLGALVASSATYVPPVVALAIGALLVGEPIVLRDYAATALILAAVAVVAIANKYQLTKT